MPPHLVADLSRATFSNIEYQSLNFVMHSLTPWLVRIEQGIIKDLLLEEEQDTYFPKFNVDGLLRGDYQSRMNGYATGISNGFLSPNDVHRLENMDLIPAEEGGETPESALASLTYDLLRRWTGIRPPWGKMTGVRQVRLVHDKRAAGWTEEQIDDFFLKRFDCSPEKYGMVKAIADLQEPILKAGSAPKTYSLYIGIPFCPSRCSYCSFVSCNLDRDRKMVQPYVDCLCREVEEIRIQADKAGLTLCSIYIGGGTPTTLSARQLDALCTQLAAAFDLSALREFTVEAGRPDTITADKLQVLRAHRVDRISVNPQTLDDRVLDTIGRRHTAQDIYDALRLVRETGGFAVNMDLIAGLPEDTAEGFRRSLDRCLTYGPDDITVHTLALKKGSRILTEGLRIPGAETVAEMLDYASPTLRTAGYRPYYLYRQKYMSGSFENIGWCRSGGECWYNVDIMSELCSILSFGAAGSTKMVVPGTSQIQRAFNVKYPTEYIQRPEKWQANQTAFAAFYEAL